MTTVAINPNTIRKEHVGKQKHDIGVQKAEKARKNRKAQNLPAKSVDRRHRGDA